MAIEIVKKISERAPTQHTKLVIALLVLFEGAVFVLMPFLNPITLQLEEQSLTWFRIAIALVLALLASLFVNIHLANKLTRLGHWIDERVRIVDET